MQTKKINYVYLVAGILGIIIGADFFGLFKLFNFFSFRELYFVAWRFFLTVAGLNLLCRVFDVYVPFMKKTVEFAIIFAIVSFVVSLIK